MTLRILSILALLSACSGPGGGPGTDGGPGSRERWERYVRGDVDRRLVMEVDAVPGAEPRSGVESTVVDRMRDLLDKPDGIEIVRGGVIASRGADHAWTFEELQALAADSFDDDSPAGTITMHTMWLDGHYHDDSASGATLGLAWANTYIVMFRDTIESSCGGIGPIGEDLLCSTAQSLVWLHEVGHVIGLVNNPMPMVSPHEDAEHDAHDHDEGCLMYWSFDQRAGIAAIQDSLLGGGTRIDFDAACLADINAVRER